MYGNVILATFPSSLSVQGFTRSLTLPLKKYIIFEQLPTKILKKDVSLKHYNIFFQF